MIKKAFSIAIFGMFAIHPAIARAEISIYLFGKNVLFPDYCTIDAKRSVELKGIKLKCDPNNAGAGFTADIEERKGDFWEYYTSPTRTIYLKDIDGKLNHYFSNFRREGIAEDDLYDYVICDIYVCLRLIYWPNEGEKISNLIGQFSKVNLDRKYRHGR